MGGYQQWEDINSGRMSTLSGLNRWRGPNSMSWEWSYPKLFDIAHLSKASKRLGSGFPEPKLKVLWKKIEFFEKSWFFWNFFLMKYDGNRWDLWFLGVKSEENIGKTSNFDKNENFMNFWFFFQKDAEYFSE